MENEYQKAEENMENNEFEIVGRLMQNKFTTNKETYIFLGLVSEKDPSLEEINTERRLGWFTSYPLRLERGGFESEVSVFAWFIDLFEDIKPR